MYSNEKYKTNRNKDPLSIWITKSLLKSITKKNTLYKQYLKPPTNGNLQKFKTYRNRLTVLIRKSKRMHFFTKFEKKNNMKQTWQAINDIIGKGRRQSSQCEFKDESNNTISNSHDISDKFNDFFL